MAADTDKIKHLLNNLNLGTSQAKVGDYIVEGLESAGTAGANVAAAAAVDPIADPSSATAEDVATALNAVIAALAG